MKKKFLYIIALLLFFIAIIDSQESGWSQKGIASWYGGKFQGRLTANGEIFDTNKLTAAHKKLPFNTIVRVYNKTNGKTVDVRINDRGPFIKRRIIDLSYKAAQKIEMSGSGIAPVVLKIIKKGDGATYHHEHRANKVLKWIQVGAYSKKTYAITQLNRLKKQGFKSEMIVEKGLYKVGIAVTSKDSISSLKEKLSKQGYKTVHVRKK